MAYEWTDRNMQGVKKHAALFSVVFLLIFKIISTLWLSTEYGCGDLYY